MNEIDIDKIQTDKVQIQSVQTGTCLLDWLTFIALYPKIYFNRFYCWLFPNDRQLWNVITPYIILGALPYYESDLEYLSTNEKVDAIINVCREWNPYQDIIQKKYNLEYLYLPVSDFTSPNANEIHLAVEFMRNKIKQRKRVYVHCKAGRSRSAILVIMYLAKYENMTCQAAHEFVRNKRPNIKYKLDHQNAQNYIQQYL